MFTDTNRCFDVLNNMQDALFIWEVEKDGSFGPVIEINEAAVKQTGYSRDELSSMTIWQFYKESSQDPLLDWRDVLLATGKARFERIHTRKNGKKISVEMSLGLLIRDNLKIVIASSRKIPEQISTGQAIPESEKKYRTVFELSHDGIAIVNLEGKFIDANQAYLDMLGYTREEIMGADFKDFTPEKWIEFEEYIVNEQIVSRGYTDVYEKEYVKKDGTVFPISIRLALMKDDEGNPIAVWGIIRDITTQKRIENQLKEQNKALELLNSQLPVLVWTVDRALRFTAVYGRTTSPTFRKKIHEMVGNTLHWYFETDDVDFPPLQAHLQALEGRQVTYEMEDNDIFRSVTVSPRSDEKGDIIGIIGVSIDITELKHTERELRESKTQLDLILSQIPAVIWLADSSLHFTEFYGARMSSEQWQRLQNLKGKYIDEVYSGTGKLQDEELLKAHHAALNGETGRFERTWPDGTIYEALVQPLRNEKNEIVGIIGAGIDITERKRLETELFAKNKELDDFAYMVSHDLKAPLGIISGYMEILREQPDMCNELQPRIDKQVNDLTGMIDAVLRLSRAGRIIGKKIPVNIENVIRESFLLVSLNVPGADLVVPARLPVIQGDPGRLGNLFTNLFRNAITFRDPEKAKIVIEVSAQEKEPGSVVVSVKDNGLGIDPKIIDKIFLASFTTRKNEGGTGFGLAISKKIVEAHGGRIWAESDGKGQGATFFIELPR